MLPWRNMVGPNRSSVHALAVSRNTVVRYWIRAISRCWPAFSNTGKSSPCRAEKSLRIMVSDRTIGTALCAERSPVHLARQHFPGSSGFRARAFPSAIHDLSPPCETPAFRHSSPTSRRKGAFLCFSFGGCDRSAGRNGLRQSPSCEESGARQSLSPLISRAIWPLMMAKIFGPRSVPEKFGAFPNGATSLTNPGIRRGVGSDDPGRL